MQKYEKYPLQCKVNKKNYQTFQQMYPHMLTAFVDRAIAQAISSPERFDLIFFGTIIKHNDDALFDV